MMIGLNDVIVYLAVLSVWFLAAIMLDFIGEAFYPDFIHKIKKYFVNHII